MLGTSCMFRTLGSEPILVSSRIFSLLVSVFARLQPRFFAFVLGHMLDCTCVLSNALPLSVEYCKTC